MNDYVWVVELAIKAGKYEDFKELMNEMIPTIQVEEPGTLNYEIFLSSDQKTCHTLERYLDGNAYKLHLEKFNAVFANRFGAVVDVSKFTVYGNPDGETRKILDGFGAIIMAPLFDYAP